MRQFEENTHTFILRIWQEPRELPGAPPAWRGSLVHLPSETRIYFYTLDELVEYLTPYIQSKYPAQMNAMEDQTNSIFDENPDTHSPPSAPLPDTDPLNALLPALERLDQLLAESILVAESVYGPESIHDPYRGLHISPEEAVRLLQREPAAPFLHPEAAETSRSDADPSPPSVGESEPGRTKSTPAAFAWLGNWFKRRGPQEDEPSEEAPLETPLTTAVPTGPPTANLPLVETLASDSKIAWLARVYQLTPFDLDVLLIGLAPELDLRYERLYAYLQDDVTCRRPSVDLALNLLCANAEEKAARRLHFSPQAPLVQLGLIHLENPRSPTQTPLLDHAYRVDDQFVRLLVREYSLDPRLADFSSLIPPAEVHEGEREGLPIPPISPMTASSLAGMTGRAWNDSRPLRLYLHGPAGVGKYQAVRWAADRLGAPLLKVDLTGLLRADPDLDWGPQLIFREAWFQNAILYLTSFDHLRESAALGALRRLWEALVRDEGITILAGEAPWKPVSEIPGGVLSVGFPVVDFDIRRSLWDSQLSEAGVALPAEDLDHLASRFHLTPAQIQEASLSALNQVRWRAYHPWSEESHNAPGEPTAAQVTLDDLFAAARQQTGHHLADLAVKIDPLYYWDDIILPEDTLLQLHEISQRVAHRHTVLEDMGFELKLSRGKGVTVLFAGSSGTGKTMAAEILANDLGLDLYRIDLSGVVSKYIGETEKNLERIFQAAEKTDAILFFDEADSIFGKRSEVRDAHDRYANIEISYLLQKMEAYDGITILATNLRQNLDEAFTRRLAFTVSFPLPDVESRWLIWEGIWPDGLELSFSHQDLEDLADRFRLSGGNIKNVALAAAFLAAADNTPIGLEHLLHAVRREYQKMGKTLSDEELFGALREPVPA